MTVVPLKGLVPPSRDDFNSWTWVRIQESTLAAGPWVQIDRRALVPDTNPARPQIRNITTQNGTLNAGYYRVVWEDVDGDLSPPSIAVYSSPTLDAESVRVATAGLMAYRLKEFSFSAGRGGAPTRDFTENTTPPFVDADAVTARNAGIVVDDFPLAGPGDEPELRTIAALRSAIELENSAPNVDSERIAEWRLQLREHVERAESGGGGGGVAGPGDGTGNVMRSAVWDFGHCDDLRAPGSELPYERCRRLVW